jgi:hypothetical protein
MLIVHVSEVRRLLEGKKQITVKTMIAENYRIKFFSDSCLKEEDGF